jgi:arsenate reductase
MLKILFLCTGNSCRSQMAEGWARSLHQGVIQAFSAGTTPTPVNPLAIQVMREAGVDISGQVSKHLNQFMNERFDAVITVCDSAREACPVFSDDVKKLHFYFDDPPALAKDARTEAERLAVYRRVRDEIKVMVEKLPLLLLK